MRFIKLSEMPIFITELRSKKHLSLQQVYLYTGIPKSSLNAYEAGHRVPSLENFCKLMKFYGYDITIQKIPRSQYDKH